MTSSLEPWLDKAAMAARLSPGVRRLHLAVLGEFVETGQPHVRADLDGLAVALGGDPAALVAELAGHDLVAFDGGGEIRAAYPFSPGPTGIRVTWPGGPLTYAMCAVDGLGMSAMLDRPVTITAAEPGTGRVLTVEVTGDRARWDPGDTVVFAGMERGDGPGYGGCVAAVDRACGQINFFTSRQAAQAWAAPRPQVTGAVLDQAGALAWGVASFGRLIRPA